MSTDELKSDPRYMKEESIVNIIENEKQLIKEFALKFFFWWYNQKGTNTSQGFDSYMETVEGMLEFNKLIAGRSKGIESEKAKDLRIKELEDSLQALINDWIGEEPFKDEPTFKNHNNGIIGDFSYWSPAAKQVKAELIFKAKQLLNK